MKETGPEKKENRLPAEAKNAGIMLTIFAALLAVTAAVAKVVNVIDPPEVKYRIAIKTIPSKNGEPISLDVKLVKQCIEDVIPAAPASNKTFYKDCE